MNPILVEIYSTILPSMPYLIAAYVLLWLVLLIYVLIIMRGVRRAEKQMGVLEEALRDSGKLEELDSRESAR